MYGPTSKKKRPFGSNEKSQVVHSRALTWLFGGESPQLVRELKVVRRLRGNEFLFVLKTGLSEGLVQCFRLRAYGVTEFF